MNSCMIIFWNIIQRHLCASWCRSDLKGRSEWIQVDYTTDTILKDNQGVQKKKKNNFQEKNIEQVDLDPFAGRTFGCFNQFCLFYKASYLVTENRRKGKGTGTRLLIRF